jgi:fucose permease
MATVIQMDFLQDKKKKQQFLCSYGVFIINGMLALSIGSLLPYIRDIRGLDYGFCGLIVSLHSVGNLVSSFAAGLLPTVIGRKKSILLFNAFFAISFLMIIFGNSNFVLALAFFLTGMARGATSNFCNTTINSLAPGKAAIINGLHAMFAIGAFLFPLILALLTNVSEHGWIAACYFMLIMGIISWVLYLLLPMEQETPQASDVGAMTKESGLGFFKETIFYLCTITLFFYLCAEQGVIGWMITYFKDTGLLNASLSQITASVLWIMILAGRLTTAWLSTRFPKERLLLVMGAGMVGFFFLLLFSRSTPWIVFGIMGFGYSMAGIYPTTVSFSGRLIEKYSLAWSFILTLASIGSIIMPSIIGKIAEVSGIFWGMSSIVVVVLIDLVCIVGLVSYVRKGNGGISIENGKK